MTPDRPLVGLPVLAGSEVPLYQGDMEADLRVVARNRRADQITGGLSLTSKMPCPSWGISATRCRVGRVLAAREGTVCSGCYALKGRYTFPAVQARLEQRYRGIFHPLWAPAMVFLIRYYCDRYFRLFDSGDIQGVNHLRNLITVARHVPDVRIWLPTREYDVVRACADAIPDNLTVRLSAQRVDGSPPSWWPTTSSVTATRHEGPGICPASSQGNRCGDCRACWERSVASVTYPLH